MVAGRAVVVIAALGLLAHAQDLDTVFIDNNTGCTTSTWIWNPCATLDALGTRAYPTIIDALDTRDGSIRLGALTYLSFRATASLPTPILERLAVWEHDSDPEAAALASLSLVRTGQPTASRIEKVLRFFAPDGDQPTGRGFPYYRRESVCNALRQVLPLISGDLLRMFRSNEQDRESVFWHTYAIMTGATVAGPKLGPEASKALLTIFEVGLRGSDEMATAAFKVLRYFPSDSRVKHNGALNAVVWRMRNPPDPPLYETASGLLEPFAPDPAAIGAVEVLAADTKADPNARAEAMGWLLSPDVVQQHSLDLCTRLLKQEAAGMESSNTWMKMLQAIQGARTNHDVLLSVVRSLYRKNLERSAQQALMEAVASLRHDDLPSREQVTAALRQQNADLLWVLESIVRRKEPRPELVRLLSRLAKDSPVGGVGTRAMVATVIASRPGARPQLVANALAGHVSIHPAVRGELVCTLLPENPSAFFQQAGRADSSWEDETDLLLTCSRFLTIPGARSITEQQIREIARSVEHAEAKQIAYLVLARSGLLTEQDVSGFKAAGYVLPVFWKRAAAEATRTDLLLLAALDDTLREVPADVWCADGGRLIRAAATRVRRNPPTSGLWQSVATIAQSCGGQAAESVRTELTDAFKTVDPPGDGRLSEMLAAILAFGDWPASDGARLAAVLVERGLFARPDGRIALEALGSPSPIALLKRLRTNRPADPRQLGALLQALSVSNTGSDAIEALCRELKPGDQPYVPDAAASALGSARGAAVKDAASCLARTSRDPSVPEGARLEALRAIGDLGPNGFEQWRLLAGYVSDPNPFGRRYALYGLRRVNAPIDVLPVLRRALKDEDVDVRNLAAAAIGSFGQQAAAALPEVRALESDPQTAPFARCARAKITGSWRDINSPDGSWQDMGRLTSTPRLLPDIPKPLESAILLPVPPAAEKSATETYDWILGELDKRGYAHQLAHYLVDDGKAGGIKGIALLTPAENIDPSGERLPGARRFSSGVQPLGSIDSHSFSSAVRSWIGEFVRRLDNNSAFAHKRMLLLVLSAAPEFQFPSAVVNEPELFRIQFSGARVLSDDFRSVLSPRAEKSSKINCQAWVYEFDEQLKLTADLDSRAHLCKMGLLSCPN